MSWDGKMYDKYRIEHTDETPLKGKKYFVLRLDSDDPVEAARSAAAMRAYKREPRNCDVGTVKTQFKRYRKFCKRSPFCSKCEIGDYSGDGCFLAWAQMPYKKGGNDRNE